MEIEADGKSVSLILLKQGAEVVNCELMDGWMILQHRLEMRFANYMMAASFMILIDFGLSFTSTLPEDKAVDLYVLERALLSMHFSCGNVMDRILAAYRRSSKQWSSKLNKLAQVRQRGRKRTMVG